MIVVFALLGLLVSVYALYVKLQLRKDKNYKPLCDINSKVSCSAVLKSSYATLFYLPNALVGVVFYLVIILLVLLKFEVFLIVLTSIAAAVSLLLFYLMARLEKTCVVCIASYLVNIGLFLAVLL